MCSDESDFVGGHRMEALLQALHHEREAGGFFKKFINRSASKVLLKQNLIIKSDSSVYVQDFSYEALTNPFFFIDIAKSYHSFFYD
jgi:hypothetical protein